MRQQFARRYGPERAAQATLVAAPGRVNLIGEHTDYNEGFVFPIALHFCLRLMGTAREDRRVRVYSLDYADAVEFDLDRNERDEEHPWSNYLRSVLTILQEAGHSLRGMDVLVAGDVPQGAGLSSSAAFEVAAAMLAQELFALDLPALEMVRLCQRAENTFVGVNCGIMDQFISRLGRAGQALLLDCRDLSYSYCPLDPARTSVVVVNSGVKHALVASEYNQRRRECEAGVAGLQAHLPGIVALRDIGSATLAGFEEAMDPVVARRCRYVVEENERTQAAERALQEGDVERFGALMYASHAGLRDLYEVSCPELDLLVDLARGVEGVFGTRMTGGGFGGCTVSLVAPGRVEGFCRRVADGYEVATGRRPEIYVCAAAEGARVVED